MSELDMKLTKAFWVTEVHTFRKYREQFWGEGSEGKALQEWTYTDYSASKAFLSYE